MADKFLFTRMGSTPSQKLLKNMQARHWPTWNGQSVRKVSAQAAFRTYMAAHPAKNKGDAWVCGVVPVHQLISTKSVAGHDCMYFTLGIFEHAVCAWPMKLELHRAQFLLSGAAARPAWLHFFSIDEVKVVPAFMCSPLRVAAEHTDISLDAIGPNLSCGSPMQLLDWQVEHGLPM